MSDDISDLIQKAAGRVDGVEGQLREALLRIAELETKSATLRTDRQAPANPVLDLLTKSQAVADFRAGNTKTAVVPMPLTLKSLLGSTAFPPAGSPTNTYDVQAQRDDRLWGYALRPTRLLDVLPSQSVSSNAFEFHRRSSSYANAAGEQTAEGNLKNQGAVHTTLHECKVATYAHWIPISEQLLADAPQLENILRTMLLHGLADKIETDLVQGTATIDGLLTQATLHVGGSSYRIDRVSEAMATMEASGYRPTHIIMSPGDWREQTRRKDAELRYLLGDPAANAPQVLWNTPVVTTAACPDDQWIVIDASKMTVLDRQSASVELGRQNDDFTRNIITMRAEARVGFAAFDLNAILKLNFQGSPSPN